MQRLASDFEGSVTETAALLERRTKMLSAIQVSDDA
jgi:hypothetical protein